MYIVHSLYRWIRREVEETLSGVYMVNIHLQVEIVDEGMKMVTKKNPNDNHVSILFMYK
jgi:hypothetical protein